MPTYNITDPSTGKTATVTGDSMPSADDIDEIFGHPSVSGQPASTQGANQNVLQQAVGFGKGILGGALNSGAGLLTGAANLLNKGANKLGLMSDSNTAASNAQNLQDEKVIEQHTNATLGTPGPVSGFIGGALPYAAIPGGGETDALVNLSPYLRALMNVGKTGAANATLGAAASEGAGQSPAMGAVLGGTAGVGAGFLKEVAPSWLKFLADPSKASKESVNPLTTTGARTALEQGSVPFFGGAGAAAKSVGNVLSDLNQQRSGLMDQTGGFVNVTNLVNKARQQLQDQAATMKNGVTLSDATAAEKWLQDFQNTAATHPNYNPSNAQLPLSDAMQLKTGLGANTNFPSVDPSNAGRNLASRTLYGQAKNAIETRMGNSPQAEQFSDVNSQMQQLSPLQEALRNQSTKPGISQWELARDAMSLGGGLAGGEMLHHPVMGAIAGLTYPALSIARRLPGTATAMFHAPDLVPPTIGAMTANNTLQGIANPDSGNSPNIPSYLLPYTAGR